MQRAIRGVDDFTVADEVRRSTIEWETTGTKPAGDDVLTAATVAQSELRRTDGTAPGVDDARRC